MKDNYIAYGSKNYTYGNLLDKRNYTTIYLCDKIKNIDISYFKITDSYEYIPYLFKIGKLKFFKDKWESWREIKSFSKVIDEIRSEYNHKFYIHFDKEHPYIFEYPFVKINFIDGTFIKFYFDANSEAMEFSVMITEKIKNKNSFFALHLIMEEFKNLYNTNALKYINERDESIDVCIKKKTSEYLSF